MKKNMKKILALLLVVSMTLGTTLTVSATEATLSSSEEQQDTETVVSDETAEEQEQDREAAIENVLDEPVEASEANIATTDLTITSKPADGTTSGQPFAAGTGGSQNFRIPAMVTLSDGTIVAATDARWNTTSDGYGLDTIVSRSSDGGATWNYTFANYFGDNGNVSNTGSTAFIDPSLAVSANDTIYMLVDLYPAGGIISSISSGTGYNTDGKLMLSTSGNGSNANYGYYLDNGRIYKNNGTVVNGLQVDDYFNLTGTYNKKSYNTNLFFSDSPFKVLKTSYLYLTKSTDGGRTWSAPTMLNFQVKDSSDKFYGVGPGRGLTTTLDNGTERIIFPCYTYTSTDGNTSVIYSDDGGQTWIRSDDMTEQSSEATLTEVNGKIYMFTRHGGYYVSEDHGATWGSKQKVDGISYTTSCQMNVITYSKTIDGKDAILLSAGTSGRTNGKIFVGLVQDDGSIKWSYNYQVNTGTYQYSCMSELNDGKIALLYENGSASEQFVTYSIENIASGATIGEDKKDTQDDSSTATVKVGGSAEISIPDSIGTNQTVTWTSSDYAKAGVYSEDGTTATLTGRATGTTVVTATVKDKEGKVVTVYTWNVTVTKGSAANAGKYTVTYTINNTIYNGKLYYSVDGSELVEVPVESQTTDEDGNTIYTYTTISVEQENVAYSQMELFVKPDEGYAVSTLTATKGETYAQYYGIDKENLKVLYGKEHTGNKIEDCLTEEQEKALLAEAVEKGCDAVFWYSCGSESSNLEKNATKTVSHEVHCDKLPTVTKEIQYLKHDNEYKEYTEGMNASVGDSAVFKIVVSTYKETADITYMNASLTDIMPDVAGEVKLYISLDANAKELKNPYDITETLDTARTTSGAKDYTFYAVYELKGEDLEQLITNNVELSYNYSSTYSTGTYGGAAKANTKFYATSFEGIDDIVVDYGSPVTTKTKAWGTEKLYITGAANYGNVKVEGDNTTGIQVTYTPTKVLTEADTVTLTNSKGGVYKFKVYPATTVYYEEGFGTYTNPIQDSSDKGTNTQTVSSVGSKVYYGYDSSYDNNTQDSDNAVVELGAGGKGEFSFKGTGVELYARSTPDSGKIMAYLYKGTALKKLYTINTKQAVGTSELTEMQNQTAYSAPVLSVTGLEAGEYTIKFEVVKTTNDNGTKEIKPVYIDGYRVYSDTTYNEQYAQDEEDNPTFTELRNEVLTALDVDTTKSVYANQIAEDLVSQVYDKTTGTGAVIVDNAEETDKTAQDLLDNGPKNEIYLNPNQAVVFQFANGITAAQIGLKALQGKEANYIISYQDGSSEDKTLKSSTDMFYKLDTQKGTITITNKDASGVLAITKIKTFGEISGNAMFAELTADDFVPALLSLGYETEKPMADATANINLVDYTGKTIASTSLTANGEQGTDATFTADQIQSAVTSVLPEGYAVADTSKIADQTVKYGESADVNVQIGKVATLKVTYKKLFGKTVGTATLTGVQTSAGDKYSFSASEIKKAVPDGYWTIKLWGTKVKYGTTGTLTVNVF